MPETQPVVYALDVETTGVDPLTCALREVALVPLGADLLPAGEPFVRTVRRRDDWPSRLDFPPPPDDEFIRQYGIPPDEGDEPWDVARDLEAWLAPRFSLCGRNVGSFDAVVLRRYLSPETWRRCDYHFRDSAALQLAMQDAGLLPPGRMSLKTLAEALGIAWVGERHRALPDAKMEARVYAEMVARLRG